MSVIIEGVMNEHQLHIGESTCSGVFGTSAVGSGGKALLSVNELSRLAMERCSSSRVAVQMMGDLAEKHGFYGAGSFEGTAESLLVGDTIYGPAVYSSFLFHPCESFVCKAHYFVGFVFFTVFT